LRKAITRLATAGLTVALVVGFSQSAQAWIPKHTVCGGGKVVLISWTAPAGQLEVLFGGPNPNDIIDDNVLTYRYGSASYNSGLSNLYWGFGSPYSNYLKTWTVSCSAAR
jgi:hypothetical protein